MKMIAFNASPRKTRNTATLLEKALEGAASEGFGTELVHLVDADFKGCISCFACKLKGGKSYGACAVKDELAPLLAKAKEADALVVGAPNYLGSPSGIFKSFLERLVYPYLVYDKDLSSVFGRVMPTGFIYTMGATDELMGQMGYDKTVGYMEELFRRFFGKAESLVANDTTLFDDHSKYVSTRFDPEAKAKARRERFPVDCRRAFEMGARLARLAANPHH
jgi:multimeric flavodoxin WrbA